MAEQQQQQQQPPKGGNESKETTSSTTSTSTSTATANITTLPPVLPHQPDESLLEVFRYVNSVPGKDVRGKLIDCFQLWFQVASPDILTVIKDIVGDLHNASLLIDDIEDNSRLRRGIPVAHSIFGIPTTINTANYVYFLALEKVHALQNAQATQVFVGELLNLHRGQGHDIQWRDASTCPTEEQYLSMVCDKTGGLFRLAVGLMQAFATSNKNVDFSSLVNNLAMYFQIRDDFINLADEEYMKSKSFCEDLTEGKYSFPIIHCIRQNPHDTRLASILKQRTEDVDVKRYAQGIMKQSQSLLYTRQKCSALKHDIVQQVQDFGGNPPLLKILETLDVQLENLGITDDASVPQDTWSAIVEQT
jgi:geranylgeranyl diphosphate synthase, type III